MGVNIYSKAIKPTVDLEDGVTVYVPGYASIGPEEPTLCSSISEFEGYFGSSPYLFEADQSVSKIAKGSPEKGYLYAKSLLSSGLTVLFHRFKTEGVKTAKAEFTISYFPKSGSLSEKSLVVQANSFGKGYSKTLVKLKNNVSNLFDVTITDSAGEVKDTEVISLDPNSSIYLRTVTLPLVEFKTLDSSGSIVELEDTFLSSLCELEYVTLSSGGKLTQGQYTIAPKVTLKDNPNTVELEIEPGPTYEFYLDDSTEGETEIKGMISKLGDSTSGGMMYPLLDFEKYPSISYLTTGGYYTETNPSVAVCQLQYAQSLSSIALVDWDKNINDSSSWITAKSAFANISGTTIAKGRSAAFAGCNSFDLSPYRIRLADSFNYLKSLGANLKSGIKAWIPVANDPNGVSPLGYDTTQKISTQLAETMAEGKIGVFINPLIYSKSAGGYKIMGNRTLAVNDGVLDPNSFLNVAVVVSRIERACRQVGNKLKIVSTNPDDTFLKFKQGVSKTIDPMVVSQDGVLSYKVKHLPKTEPSTINIQIHLVVLEGIEKFNIYIPYELQLD